MNQLLKIGMTVQTEDDARSCRVEQFLGGGGQGEVYCATLDGAPVALKWYFPAQATAQQRRNLQLLIAKGAPTARFLWPLALTVSPDVAGFGYLMPLREPRYHSIVDLMKRRIELSFRVLATAGLELVHSFLELHARGLCYQDISFGNVCFDPTSGEVLIGDNDNVGVDGETCGSVLGTPRFIAPEVVRGEAAPSTQTDLFSLAVLLFYMFMIHHPLEGSKEAAIRCFDLPAMTRLYGTEPVFIFDPADDSNRPLPGYHDNALVFWPIYPEFFRALFTRAFTEGIHDPLHGRVRESEWRAALAQLRDLIVYCARCGAENFYDPGAGQSAVQTPGVCWSCRQPLRWPPRLHIGRQVIMLNHDCRLFPHHLEQQFYDFSTTLATVAQHPANPAIWGLKNLAGRNWIITLNGGTIKEVEPSRSVTLAAGTRINFGGVEGDIRC